MKTGKRSKLEPYAAELDGWFDEEQLTLAQVQARLQALGCLVSRARLGEWRRRREGQRTKEQLLEQLATGARHCKTLEKEFGNHPAPKLETLIKMHRFMVFELATKHESNRQTITLMSALMRPVMEWARVQEERKKRELAEQKYRDELEAKKAASERELNAAKSSGGLSLETLEKIERELNLM